MASVCLPRARCCIVLTRSGHDCTPTHIILYYIQHAAFAHARPCPVCVCTIFAAWNCTKFALVHTFASARLPANAVQVSCRAHLWRVACMHCSRAHTHYPEQTAPAVHPPCARSIMAEHTARKMGLIIIRRYFMCSHEHGTGLGLGISVLGVLWRCARASRAVPMREPNVFGTSVRCCRNGARAGCKGVWWCTSLLFA